MLSLLVALAALPVSEPGRSPAGKDLAAVVTLSPERVPQGQVSLLRIGPAGRRMLPADLRASRGETDVALFECPDAPAAYCGLVPVPMDATPGKADVILAWGGGNRVVTLHVTAGKYRKERLTVDPAITRPSEADLKRIERERAIIAAAYAVPAFHPLWDGPFRMPTSGKITSRFGNQRLFNGEVKSFHSGVDLRAATGVPIYAANAGEVRLARDLFYAGNLVVLDHGMGLYTSYAHLSRLDVRPGQRVKKGQRLGLAGATGRVNGPHLHWSMRVNGVVVDPIPTRTLFNRLFRGAPKRPR